MSITALNIRLLSAAWLALAVSLTACGQNDPDTGGGAANSDGRTDEAQAPLPFGKGVLLTTEPVRGSDIPVHYYMVETVDGIYTPIALRKPQGEGPFPVVLFASGNGGGGLPWLRDATNNQSWTLERFLENGYAVAWLRYRAEVDLGYNEGGKLVRDQRQGRLMLNRGPLEYEDEIEIIEFVKSLPFIQADSVGIIGMSHGGEMALKITSEYDGVAAAVASEPASHEFLVLSPDETATVNEQTRLRNLEEMQMRETEKVRQRVDMDIAMQRISTIDTPFLVMGRDHDHLQGIFRTTYELLDEADKDARWVSFEHPEHGYVYVGRGPDGTYAPDKVQIEAVQAVLEFFDEHLKDQQ